MLLMKHLLVDFSLLAHANLFTVKSQLAIGGYQLLKHVLIRAVLKNVNEFSPDRVYICFDGGSSWRKNISETYKAQRKESREKQDVSAGGDVNWSEFYRILDELYNDFKTSFPFHAIKINSIEADDIIAYLVRTSPQDDEKIILTRDGDYIQLLQYPNTKIYNPVDRKWMESVNPIHDLQVKICMGDKSDNILAIRPRMGIATAEKFVESGELDKMLEIARKDIEQFGKTNDEMAKNYINNEKLIDMSKVPYTINNKIKMEVDVTNPGNPANLLKYFVTNGLRELVEDISKVRKTISSLS
jgi:5'-3' exonuclease